MTAFCWYTDGESRTPLIYRFVYDVLSNAVSHTQQALIIIIIFVYFGLTHATKQRKKGKGQAQMSVKNTNVISKYCNMTLTPNQ